MKKTTSGFTLVELTVVIIVIGILSTIGVLVFSGLQTKARDDQRSSKVTIIAESLEKYYANNGEYPDCSTISSNPTSVLKNISSDVVIAPKSTTNSIKCDNSNPSASNDVFKYTGISDNNCLPSQPCLQWKIDYIEESTNTIKTIESIHKLPTLATLSLSATPSSTSIGLSWSIINNASSYTLQYSTDNSFTTSTTIDNIPPTDTSRAISNLSAGTKYYIRMKPIRSRYSSTWTSIESTTISLPKYTLTTIAVIFCANENGTCSFTGTKTVLYGAGASWISRQATDNISCNNATFTDPISGTAKKCYYQDDIGTTSGAGTYSSGSTPTITATPNQYYSFSSWVGNTGCNGIYSHTITMDSNKNCMAIFSITPISAPTMTNVSNSTSGDNTTWSWTAVSCTTGNSIRYQYNYSINSNPVSSSGWTALSSNSLSSSTYWEGYTYTLVVQAQCYNPKTTSPWSASSNASSYSRLVQPPSYPTFQANKCTYSGTNAVCIKATSVCTGGSTRQIIYDLKIGDKPGFWNQYYWPSSYHGWWSVKKPLVANDTNNVHTVLTDTSKWANPTWANYSYSGIITVGSFDSDYALGSGDWGAAIKQRCTSNGIYSAESDIINSGSLTLGSSIGEIL